MRHCYDRPKRSIEASSIVHPQKIQTTDSSQLGLLSKTPTQDGIANRALMTYQCPWRIVSRQTHNDKPANSLCIKVALYS